MKNASQTLHSCVLLVSFLILASMFPLNETGAAVVWADDFNDGNYSDWTIIYGAFSTDNYMLQSLVAQSCINHPSSVIIGTWSFDFIFSGRFSSGANIGFACEEVVLYPVTGYVLKVGRSAFELVVWNQSYDWIIGAYYPSSHIDGQQQVDITREETGLIRVFINGTLRIEAVDNTLTISNFFHFFCGPDEALDNIVVSDTIDVTPSTCTNPGIPIPPQIPGFPLVAIFIGFICALSLGVLRRFKYRA